MAPEKFRPRRSFGLTLPHGFSTLPCFAVRMCNRRGSNMGLWDNFGQ